jgi:hypothetical protein
MSLPEKQNKVSCISTYISTLGRYENPKQKGIKTKLEANPGACSPMK